MAEGCVEPGSEPTSAPVREPGVWRRRTDVLWRRSLDAVILLPAGADDAFTLPGTGAAVWDALDVPTPLDELVAELAEAYDAEPGVVERDVVRLLSELEAMGAVTRGGAD